MFPGATRPNRVHGSRRDFVRPRQFLRGTCRSTNGSHIIVGESGTSSARRHRCLGRIEVAPGLARDGITQRRPVDAVEIGDGLVSLAGPASTSGVEHDLIGEYGGRVFLSGLIGASSGTTSVRLVRPIGRMSAVVDVTFEGVAARRVITVVACDCGQIAMGQVEGHPGCVDRLLRPRHRIDPLEVAVVLWFRSSTSGPRPASGWAAALVDLGPEACGEILWSSTHVKHSTPFHHSPVSGRVVDRAPSEQHHCSDGRS